MSVGVAGVMSPGVVAAGFTRRVRGEIGILRVPSVPSISIDSEACANTGRRIAARTTIIAITARSSIRSGPEEGSETEMAGATADSDRRNGLRRPAAFLKSRM
jgi:hypothetical protein